jgi:hypothetical protein
MPLTANTIEQICAWCLQSEILAGVRSKAIGEFFGYDEPGVIKYMEGAEALNPQERRFLGWFCFTFRLPDGKYPAEMAADSIFSGAELKSALKSIQDVRFIMAVVTMVATGKGAYLQLENEEFEVDSRYLSQYIKRDDVLCAHILPVGRNRWVLGPGWITWPTRFGPGIRSHLKQFQLDPVALERFLQQRSPGIKGKPKIEYPHDNTLKEAVSRMTGVAQTAGKDRLIMTLDEWKIIVQNYMKLEESNMKIKDFNKFSEDIIKRVGNVTSLDELNRWLALATNIWNNVPQPDRGNRSANEIAAEYRSRGH